MLLNLNYFMLFFLFLFSIILASILIILSFFFFTKKKTKNIRRKSLYECGFESFGDSHILINVQFITVSLLFVIFDLEILFLLTLLSSDNFLGYLGFFSIYIVLFFFFLWIFLWMIFRSIILKKI